MQLQRLRNVRFGTKFKFDKFIKIAKEFAYKHRTNKTQSTYAAMKLDVWERAVSIVI